MHAPLTVSLALLVVAFVLTIITIIEGPRSKLAWAVLCVELVIAASFWLR